MRASQRDINLIKADFPMLARANRGQPLIYLDSAASAQKPVSVLEAMQHFYTHDYANIHRGIYELSERATSLYEQGRESVKSLIHAASSDEIVFVSGTTSGINLVAASFAQIGLAKGDHVLISELEHHANIVPWQMLKKQYGIEIKVIPINDSGVIDLNAYQKLLSPKTKMVAVSHVSNALGTIQPVKDIIQLAHAHSALVLVDGAQAVPHIPVNVRELDCDFYVFSGHKLYGPTGIGVLYAKQKWLNAMPPYQSGGDMIETVSFTEVTFAPPPQKFEAGTPNMAGVVGLKAAIDYLQKLGMETIQAHEQSLLRYAEDRMQALGGIQMYGTAHPKVGVISFLVDGIHPHDLGTVLDHAGIAVRAGHHCAMPLMQRLNVPATVRVSFGIYTDQDDIDALIKGLEQAKRLFT